MLNAIDCNAYSVFSYIAELPFYKSWVSEQLTSIAKILLLAELLLEDDGRHKHTQRIKDLQHAAHKHSGKLRCALNSKLFTIIYYFNGFSFRVRICVCVCACDCLLFCASGKVLRAAESNAKYTHAMVHLDCKLRRKERKNNSNINEIDCLEQQQLISGKFHEPRPMRLCVFLLFHLKFLRLHFIHHQALQSTTMMMLWELHLLNLSSFKCRTCHMPTTKKFLFPQK